MKKYHFIVIILLGMFLMPTITYACGGCSEKQTSKKELSSKKEKDNCCDSDSHSKSKNHDGCGGKCGHTKCVCPSGVVGFTISPELTFKNNIFDFSFEKQKFFNTETQVSSGFYFLWLIPKIS